MKYYCALLGVYAAISLYGLIDMLQYVDVILFGLYYPPFILIFFLIFFIGFIKMFKVLSNRELGKEDELIKCQNIQGWTVLPAFFFSILLCFWFWSLMREHF